jgi:hypothetical protein
LVPSRASVRVRAKNLARAKKICSPKIIYFIISELENLFRRKITKKKICSSKKSCLSKKICVARAGKIFFSQNCQKFIETA